MKKLAVVFSALLLSCSGIVAATITAQPSAGTVNVGQNFTVTVDVSGVADLFGFEFDLGFDPSLLQAKSVNEGPFLALGGPTVFLPGDIDNVAGTISFNGGILGGVDFGVDGSGVLVSFDFKALSFPGTSALSLFNVTLLNSFGEGMSFTQNDGSITLNAATTSAVPEPGSGTLLLFGMALLLAAYWRFSRADRSRSVTQVAKLNR